LLLIEFNKSGKSKLFTKGAISSDEMIRSNRVLLFDFSFKISHETIVKRKIRKFMIGGEYL
jgi:hypothetical protein